MENNLEPDMPVMCGIKMVFVQRSHALGMVDVEHRQLLNYVYQLGNVANQISSKRSNPQRYRVYNINGISPTIDSAQGGGRTPCIIL